MATYSYTFTLDEMEIVLLRLLIQEYLKTATDEYDIELARSIRKKSVENMEQMRGLF